MIWFTEPDTTRLTLMGGEWMDVKTRLTHGEREAMLSAMSPYVNPGEKLQLERKEIRPALVNAYVIGWSLTRNGKPVPMSPDLPDNTRLATLRGMSSEAFDLIHAAIEAHVEATKQADEGNASGGESESSATSPSPVLATGDIKTS